MRRTNFWIETVKTFKLIARNKVGLLGLMMLTTILLLSFVGPLVVPPETQADTLNINKPPSEEHWLGTDFQGRDNFIMAIHGGRDVILVAFAAGLLTTFISVMVGSISAFFGGKIDSTLMAITDIWLTIPSFLILVVIATLVELENIWTLAVFLAVFGWPSLARQIRAQVLSLKKREYVEAAQLLDLGSWHIIMKEMLPNMMNYIMITMIASMVAAIYTQTGLVFLGVVPFGNNWGVMFSLAYAKNAIYNPNAAASLMVPIGAIILLQLSLVMFSRSLEEIFNPRLRTGVN